MDVAIARERRADSMLGSQQMGDAVSAGAGAQVTMNCTKSHLIELHVSKR